MVVFDGFLCQLIKSWLQMSNNGGVKILLIYYDEYDGLIHIEDSK